MAYRIGIARHARQVEATVFDLPGCAVGAPDEAMLHDVLPVAVAEHLAWLAAHGEHVDSHTAVDIQFSEAIVVAETTAADGEFVFEDDKRPLTDSDIETALRHMAYARADLNALVGPLPDRVLDWRPPLSAMSTVDQWNPGVLTIQEIVDTVATSEGCYRTGLGDDIVPLSDASQSDLTAQRALTVARLRSLSRDERAAGSETQRSWQDRPEHWTARKAIRRIIGHERFHTKEIEQRLAWLLLGVPDFTQTRTSPEASMSIAGRK
jgi:hypothetical protein